ncbi:hypothetical protein E2562_038977 [Oryza meyeriana var. granulata]|uniref:Uncharacterized protein n=1 Tax=Oryza meyeriana var. granulata TaxID=110450 RepID=A0A6G1FH92_9ORYZ|nr:hypothetical protein E2562_038977 [Oryza meyeriana var. granulata]
MGRKRKTGAAPRLDDADHTLYSTFSTAANSLSHLYSQAIVQQRQSFHAGKHHVLVRTIHTQFPPHFYRFDADIDRFTRPAKLQLTLRSDFDMPKF